MDSMHGSSSFMVQANALLRKSLTLQKRNFKSYCALLLFPIFLCVLLAIVQNVIAGQAKQKYKGVQCDCTCIHTNGDGSCKKVCTPVSGDDKDADPCAIPSPQAWRPLLQLPVESCRRTCQAKILLTGGLSANFFRRDLLTAVVGYGGPPEMRPKVDSLVYYIIQSQCQPNSTVLIPMEIGSNRQSNATCLKGLCLWRKSSSVIKEELFSGYVDGNAERKTSEIVTAYDFLNSDKNNFDVNIWYNSTDKNLEGVVPLRVPRLVNVVSNAYLQFLRGASVMAQFDFIKEMPQFPPREIVDTSVYVGALFYSWFILQLFPIILSSLVYEKQENLRMMMKMHGLSDGPYWVISYTYFFVLSFTYILCFVVFGSITGLTIFGMNDYGIQFLFYFVYINLQIATAFLWATIFSSVKIATVMAYIYTFGSGLLGKFLFQDFLEDDSFPRSLVIVMEIFPSISLYRGLYDLQQSSSTGLVVGTGGMSWIDMNDRLNGMKEVLIIMSVEWCLLLPVAYYLDQVVSVGSGVKKHPLFFLKNFLKKHLIRFQRSNMCRQGSNVSVQMERPDVFEERRKVGQLLLSPSMSYAVVCDNLKKAYPGKDGNPETQAVKGFSLALPRGECFGMLGPNGAGKTTSISMMIGLTTPTSGTAFIQGLDIRTDMNQIYTSMGVCPQHDLLWEKLTGREHLLFYGRLKNLKGAALTQAVEESLKAVNLFHGGVGDKQTYQYSGGMKRRLSVAISLIGDPKVVYMDEPSTGLDPASRKLLWNVVKRAKQNSAIILTTHSMEEAEVLCDRLGIFVDGRFECIGNPKELIARYGGSYVFTMTTSSGLEGEVEKLVRRICPSAKKIYHISGTQKFELPKKVVRIADVFQAVENAKTKFPVHAWGLADTSLEDVFIKKRNFKSQCVFFVFPILLCVLLAVLQKVVDHELKKDFKVVICDCTCIRTNSDGSCKKQCTPVSQDPDDAGSDGSNSCPIPSPPEWRPVLQLPRPIYLAVRTDAIAFPGLPVESCRKSKSCPATILLTGSDQAFGESVSANFFRSGFSLNSTESLDDLSTAVLGSDYYPPDNGYKVDDPAQYSLYIIQSQCQPNSTIPIPFEIGSTTQTNATCLSGLCLWRKSSSAINEELFSGYIDGNEIVSAYDFLNSDKNNFKVNIWYNSSYKSQGEVVRLRVPRLVNLVSSAYLQFLRGAGVMAQFDFIKEMPQFPPTSGGLDPSSYFGVLIYTWFILQLFPVMLTSLVYEKQENLRMMMKMHGLSDGAYWAISYAYFFVLSFTYILCLVVFGSITGLKIFTMNDYSIQFLFYFIYINLQITTAFLLATIFSRVKIATVIAYIYAFGSGLIGKFLFQDFLEDESFPRRWIVVMEFFPSLSLFRGLYDLQDSSSSGLAVGSSGMRWIDMNDRINGMKEVLIIMFLEWCILLPVAYYLDQVVSVGSGVRKHPLFFLKNFQKKHLLTFQRTNMHKKGSNVSVEMEKPDVTEERKKVKKLLLSPNTSYAVICDNLEKMYHGKDGNPEIHAVKGFSLALPQGECFGMLGPNGAGKTTSISMMIGLTIPTSGTAFIQGMDIRTDMNKIYTSMGVCPQHDLLWEKLTGREHLLFYGRLKNLKGSALTQAVEESLKNFNLFHGGVGDKRTHKYSGGMKRRLSVAISLIGDPKVVYMDEPSSGLDPASRNLLWNVVKRAKQNRAIILTTHSMQEAEVLCDRLGIFVDGKFECIGNPKELIARYGGSYVFTMTTSSAQDDEVEKLVRGLCPNAKKIYNISGTQKFELPKEEVRIADVFQAVENAKTKFTVHAWGLADTSLEDVFVKVAGNA
ncbi:hypothetical protein IFM89_022389 [Coptis chinensis]|uniref:ABC transporter domain-containing protein n=1 Tax=Coptis chinensis TaxID=261450 RepID=A0A835MFN9_9MAGN|nr:hypothetical protein IFM89_022389 [Coptis chinensis]